MNSSTFPDDLRRFRPRHRTLVAIDSDGCAFDTMETKQTACFFPEMVRHWRLEAVEDVLRETAAFVGLYSQWRGQNRFRAIVKTFEYLGGRPEAVAAGIRLPDLTAIRAYVESGMPLSNDTLEAAVHAGGPAELRRLLDWSRAVDRSVAERARNLPPFPPVRDVLMHLAQHSDLIVCSQTPVETLEREWAHHDLRRFVRLIAGPEHGAKADHLALAAAGRYSPDRILMVGDAPGDLDAAQTLGACFFPIHPGDECRSWRRLRDEAYDRFLARAYRGAYEQHLVEDYQALLPADPPWQSEST